MKCFAQFRLDTENQCLWRQGLAGDDERILLTPKAFLIIRHLVDRSGRLVTHAEFLEAVWPGTYVQPEVLKSHIFEIRAALGDDAKKPVFIETLPRRGYRFIAPVNDRAAVGPAPSPIALVGRQRALSKLRETFRKMLTGDRQIVFITGEPGIGKTALVEVFTQWVSADAPDVRIARGQCIEGYGSKEAYYPMLAALAELCRGDCGDAVVQILAAQAPTWLLQFPALVEPGHGDVLNREVLGATRERMLREIGDALEAIASRGPLIIVFEDLQWVDRATIDLISVLARRRAPATLMLMATYRDEDVVLSDHPLRHLKQDLHPRRLCREVALDPLAEAHVEEYLLADAPAAPLPDGLARLVYRHSEGNPLFMVTALDHMRAHKLIEGDGRGWELRAALNEIEVAVTESLRGLIEARVERLSTEEPRVPEVASLTQHRSFSVVARAAATMDSEPERFEAICDRLSRRTRILRPASLEELPDGTVSPFYDFAHALYREVLYERIPPARRVRLHRQAAEWAEGKFAARVDEAAPFLAHHFEHGLDWAQAVKYLRVAADTAGRRYAPREATALLEHALELSLKLADADRTVHEPAILKQLAQMYVVSFDPRAVDTYKALAARAEAYGLLDLEVKTLIDMAYPTSWVDGTRCLRVLDRVMSLGARQADPLQRARTRASCLVRRIWTAGWNPRDADACREALEEIRERGDRLLVAVHLIDFNFIRWTSSEYRTAHQEAVQSLAVLVDKATDNPYLSFALWLSEFTRPWSLLFLGEWGEALRTLTAGIALANKNGDRYRAQTLQLYRAWIHLHAMDYVGVLETCHSVLPSLDQPARSPWRRYCLALLGSAEAASGLHEQASEHLLTVQREMTDRPVINDWYCRMMLEEGLVELSLVKNDLAQARSEADHFLELTLATAERTWQALAWETSSRVATVEGDLGRAQKCIDRALATMEGFEVPLAAWRVHGRAADLYAHAGNSRAARRHRALGRAIIAKLADSLAGAEQLRDIFLSAPSVRRFADLRPRRRL